MKIAGTLQTVAPAVISQDAPAAASTNEEKQEIPDGLTAK
jgi:hypothetical protein